MKNKSAGRTAGRIFSSLVLLFAAVTHADPFSIVVLPDTQWYASTNPQIVDAQTRWIVNNRVSENIIYVAQLGDLKDDTACALDDAPDGRSEWEVMEQAMALLENIPGLPDGIPYGVVPGNHDFDQIRRIPGCPNAADPNDPACLCPDPANPNNPDCGCPNYSTQRPLTGYDGSFGTTRFNGRSYHQGSFPDGSNENNYTLFGFGGIDFIAINLGYRSEPMAGDPALATANTWLDDFSGRIAIVTTHKLLERNNPPNTGRFSPYGLGVYNALSGNSNLFLMLSAHRRGEAWRVESRTDMNDVHILMSNYQDVLYPQNPDTFNFNNPLTEDTTNGGNSGFMRIMRFDTDLGLVEIETFAPAIPSFIPSRPDPLVSNRTVTDGTRMSRSSVFNIRPADPIPFPVLTLRPRPPTLLDIQ